MSIKNVPVQFEPIKNIGDDRFVQVKIWLMHLGANLNKSFFSKEVVQQALPTLKNNPILGYVEEQALSNKDFRGHEIELVVEDGEVKTKYIGQAYGVIPENCNPRFEWRVGEDSLEREYLVVDGLLWTKFDDPISILDESEGVVSQSMELHDVYDGFWDDNGFFNFTNFSFNGACMLGKDVSPAMVDSTVEQRNFAQNSDAIQEQISQKLSEFNKLFSQYKEVEDEMTLEELLNKYEVSSDDLQSKGVNVEDYSIEQLEEKIKEVFEDDGQTEPEPTPEPEPEPEPEPQPEPEPTPEPEPEPEPDENFTLKFELSHEDIRKKMFENIDNHMVGAGFEDDWYFVVTVYESNLIAENDKGDRFFKVGYQKDGDNIHLGEVSEVFASFLTQDEKNALELMRSNYDALEQEVGTLRDYKANIEKESHVSKVEDLFSQFSKLEDEDVSDLRENMHSYSVQEIESTLYERLGRKLANFSTKKKQDNPKINFNINKDEETHSRITTFFDKHGIKANQ